MAIDEGEKTKESAGRLGWQLDVLMELSDAEVEVYEAGPGIKIAFEGALPESAYVYLVQLDADKWVTVLYPPDDASIEVKAGERVRVPAEGWARTVTRGLVRAVASSDPITRDRIAELAGGREPPVGTDKQGNSRRGG